LREPLDEGLRWLRQAEEDFRWAADLADRGGYHIACFLAQQVGEKALKALLYARGEEIVLGHSVQRLAARIAEFDQDVAASANRWAVLDGYYVATRYPNSIPDSIPALVYNQEAAKGAVGLAGEIVALVRRRLSSKP
jgi:HEPN domain-containing protein